MDYNWKFHVSLYYNGKLTHGAPCTKYTGGDVVVLVDCDPKTWGLGYLLGRAHVLGVRNIQNFVWHLPDSDLAAGYKLLSSTEDFNNFINCIGNEAFVDVYVEHTYLAPVEEEVEVVQEGGEEANIDENDDDEEEGVKVNGREDDDAEEEGMKVNGRDDDDADFEAGYARMSGYENTRGPGDSDEDYASPDDSDNEAAPVLMSFKSNPCLEDPFCEEMVFTDTQELRNAIKDYGIKFGYPIKIQKSDKLRVVANCSTGKFPWRLYGSKKNFEKVLKVVSYEPRHTCNSIINSALSTQDWITRKYLNRFRNQPNLTPKALKEEVYTHHNVKVSVKKCYRAKLKALEIINGNHEAQYGQIWEYLAELQLKYPRSVLKARCPSDADNMPPRFQRVFVCLEPLCKAFKSYCRPIVHVDACHLKGKYPGQLVAAMGLDGNNGMFPLAYGVVEIESKETWIWFLNQLEEGIGSIEENNWAFMSDQQKGLIPALKERNAEHRFCLRHVYSNFKLKPEWHNKEMKDILDAAALSMIEKEFKMHMEKFDAKNATAAKNYLMKLGPQHWSRHLWGTRAKSGMILNNPSECFNAYIMGERDKPIVTMLEGLRKMCIKLAKDRTNKLAGYKGPVCPQAQVKLEANKKQARFWKATICGDEKFEIAKDRVQFAVNLNSMSCACNEWDLTGVPCEHAARAIFAINGTPEGYVSPYLHMSAYNSLWSVKLEPMNGENLWPASSQTRPLPPHLKRQPGRPKRVRMKDRDEASNPYIPKKRKITIVCSKCKRPDHNSRTCRGEVKNKKDHTHEYYMGFSVPIRQASMSSVRTEDYTINSLEMVAPSSENLIANPDVLTQESANLESIQPRQTVAKQVISRYNQPRKPPIPITRKLPVEAAAKAPIPKLTVKKKKPSNDGKK